MGKKVAPVLVRRDGELERVAWQVWCPACDRPHQFASPETYTSFPGWTFNGDMERPTFQPSMRAEYGEGGPVCHSFVTDGEFRYCSDSTHELAGETVPVPDWPYDVGG